MDFPFRKIFLIQVKLKWLLTRLNEFPGKKKSGGIWEQACQLFEPDNDCNQLSVLCTENIDRFIQDWDLINMFVKSVAFSSNVDEVMQNQMSVIEKIRSLVDENYELIYLGDYKCENLSLESSHKLLSLLGECQRKTDKLIETEIREAVKVLSKSAIHADYSNQDIWKSFLPFIRGNMWLFFDPGSEVLDKKLVFLYNELASICRLKDRFQRYPHDSFLFDEIFTNAASVIVRIVVHSCNFLFSRKDPEIANVMTAEIDCLLEKIDPTDMRFLHTNIAIVKYFFERQTNSRKRLSDAVYLFCRYLLNWFDRRDLEKELSSLVTLFINHRLEDREEDKHDFFADIKSVLAEVAFSHRTVQRDVEEDGKQDPMDRERLELAAEKERNLAAKLPPSPELLAKICLLKVELFLKRQLNSRNTSMLFSDDCFFKVDMILTFLRGFNKDQCQQGNSEFVSQTLVLAKELANEIESLHTMKVTSFSVKQALLVWLFRIVFFKAESSLAELLKSRDISLAHKMDQIQYLLMELTYFKGIINTKLASFPSETVIIQLEVVAREMVHLSYSYLPDHKKFEKIVHSLPQLLDKVKDIKAKLPEISQHLAKSDFPKTFDLRFFDFLCGNIMKLLKQDPKSITPVKHHLEEVLFCLESLKSFLVKVKDSDIKLGELKDLRNHIINAAYKVEYAVESIEMDGRLCQSLWLYNVLGDIRCLNQQVCKSHELSYFSKIENASQISSRIVSKDTIPEINEQLVELVDEENVIVECLTRGSSKLDVVSIVGTPGIGKSTLARKVFNDSKVVGHFCLRAWCTISQTYSKRELLLELLSHIDVFLNDITKLTDDDLLSKLHRHLLRNKYLIVMDDLRDVAAWHNLETFFPDDSNGSRILITSHSCDVVSKIKPDSDPHPIRTFSDLESWKLLEMKIFKGAVCPEELLEVGMEIAQRCQGLPLAVVAVAGQLHTLEKEKNSWERFSKSLRSKIISNPEIRCKEILELSYNHLPEHLKACFISLGVFFEDKDIPVTKLIHFWLAEGFIKETNSKSPEEIAEDYLMDLINRGLVNIQKTRSSGKVKTCRLHDLMHYLCQLKAKEEKFQQLVTRSTEPYASFPDLEDDMEFDREDSMASTTMFSSYRLSFCMKRQHFIHSRPSGLITRSLIFFASPGSEPKCPYDISFICHNFKLLRILDVESIMAIGFPVEIGLLIQLRYLSVSGYIKSIPTSISNLWKLETLVVKGLQGKVILPETIWSLRRLRHLHVNNYIVFYLQGLDEEDAGISPHLENLVSFSTPLLSCRNDRWRMLKRLPNLRKLRCIFWHSGDTSEKSNEFIRWNFLTHLESLKIICYGGSPSSRDFLLPQNLTKLSLSEFFLQENHLSVIGELPSLIVLKLRAGAFDGQSWVMQDEEFKELKFLEIDSMNLVSWDASCHHLSSLEQLILKNCKELKRIPSDFANIALLKKVEVHWCNKSVEASAQEIRGERQEINLVISHST